MRYDRAGSLDTRVREAFAVWKKLDETDVRILEGLSLLGARNLAKIARYLHLPASTVTYRVRKMLSNSILFLRLNPYHTNMGLKKVLPFVEAAPGREDDLLDCLRVNDFWIFLCRIYGPYEGCGGVWTIPKNNAEEFQSFIESLIDAGVARSAELIWSTCFQGIPVKSRWFNSDNCVWTFNWDEWINEVETIEGELPYTLIEPEDWPIKADYEDLLIIKELEKDARTSMRNISKAVGVPLSTIKYHYREHVLKRDIIEDYQLELYRFPFPLSEIIFFKFEFDDYERMAKFALSLLDKPLAIYLGKVLGENALVSQMYLLKWEFRRFVHALTNLIKKGLLKDYHYFIQDMYQTWKETIPYEHFENGRWNYNYEKQKEELKKVLHKKGVI